jgi:hypothetical protein
MVVEVRQIEGEVTPREFRLVILVVEDGRLAESFCENGRELGDEVALFSREGEGDAETLGVHNSFIPDWKIKAVVSSSVS